MGFKFRGAHSDDMGAIWQSTSRQFLPEPKNALDGIDTLDGSLDFSEYNSDSRLHYEDRLFEGTITVGESSFEGIQKRLSRISKWLIGSWDELEFDDMPETLWTARLTNAQSADYQLRKIGKANLVFRAKPFSRFRYGSNSQIPITARIPLDWHMPFKFECKTAQALAAGENIFELNAYNYGNWYTRPKITLTIKDFQKTDVAILCGEKSIAFHNYDLEELGAYKPPRKIGWDFYPEEFDGQTTLDEIYATTNGPSVLRSFSRSILKRHFPEIVQKVAAYIALKEPGTEDTVVFDFENYTAADTYVKDGVSYEINALPNISGDFWEFPEGDNVLTFKITADTEQTVTVTVDMYFKFTYGVYF